MTGDEANWADPPKLTLHFLPGYAPTLDPDEMLWVYARRTGVAHSPLRRSRYQYAFGTGKANLQRPLELSVHLQCVIFALSFCQRQLMEMVATRPVACERLLTDLP